MLRGKPRALTKGQAACHRPVVLQPAPRPGWLWPFCCGFGTGVGVATFAFLVLIVLV